MDYLKKTDRYEIRHGHDIHGGRISGFDGEASYATSSEARKQAKLFKDNPKGKNPAMSDENAEYWMKQSFTIVRVEMREEWIVTIK